jgi:hypothetical protein
MTMFRLHLYNDGTYVYYDLSRDRSTMMAYQKSTEDQTFLVEIFTWLVTASRMVPDYPFQDELLRGMS